MDVSSDETINAAYETVEARPGYLDVLVNNDSQPLEMRMFKSEYTMRKAWNQMYDSPRHGHPDSHSHLCAAAPPIQDPGCVASLLDERPRAARDDAPKYFPSPPPAAG
ncbi:hypothetical protein BBAD15_g7583 [Beauveria bassiana D1-5]|uniref:Uncharacterized protein n=1 Tax=Beauveria bassiana D1-5 TaxID=1245745 RepID=A0A0A2VHK7_BEABA|nr:hypothetical protein BBAD15_g7583 [Beauveria bassiana D1-5]